MTLELNAYKVTMLFPLLSNEGEPFAPEVWDWWLDKIMSMGYFHETTTRGVWRGLSEVHRCVVMVVAEGELPILEAFLREARDKFRQECMYLDAHPVFFKLV
jgi:hypothetical protein